MASRETRLPRTQTLKLSAPFLIKMVERANPKINLMQENEALKQTLVLFWSNRIRRPKREQIDRFLFCRAGLYNTVSGVIDGGMAESHLLNCLTTHLCIPYISFCQWRSNSKAVYLEANTQEPLTNVCAVFVCYFVCRWDVSDWCACNFFILRSHFTFPVNHFMSN